MKKLTLLLALGIGMISLCSAQAGEIAIGTKPTGYQMTINAKEFGLSLLYKETIGEIKNSIMAYRLPDSVCNEQVVLAKLDSIEQWITKLFPKVAGLRIDVIGQTHVGGPMNDPVYQTDLLESQSLIKNILLTNRYGIVGDEGNALPVITRKDVLEGNYGDNSVKNKMTPDAIAQYYAEYGLTRSTVSSLLLLPSGFNSKVIGIEDLTMWKLHLGVLGQRMYQSLDDLMVTLRSYIAFFKVAEKMLKAKVSTGAVVIGSAHTKDFVWLARSTGTHTDFYHTNSMDFFSGMVSK